MLTVIGCARRPFFDLVIHSFKYLLNTVLGSGYSAVNKTGKIALSSRLYFSDRDRQQAKQMKICMVC